MLQQSHNFTYKSIAGNAFYSEDYLKLTEMLPANYIDVVVTSPSYVLKDTYFFCRSIFPCEVESNAGFT